MTKIEQNPGTLLVTILAILVQVGVLKTPGVDADLATLALLGASPTGPGTSTTSSSSSRPVSAASGGFASGASGRSKTS